MCTVLILSYDLSDPIRSFLTALNCFDSLFFSSRCVENWFRLFFGLRQVCTSQTRENNIFNIFFHHSHIFQNNSVFFQTCQIWLNTNRQNFNSTCTVLILWCDPSDPIRTFLTALNCFDSLFLSSRCVENWLRLFFWTSLGVYQPNKGKQYFQYYWPSFAHVSE